MPRSESYGSSVNRAYRSTNDRPYRSDSAGYDRNASSRYSRGEYDSARRREMEARQRAQRSYNSQSWDAEMRRRQQRQVANRAWDAEMRQRQQRPDANQAWDAEMRRRQQRPRSAQYREPDGYRQPRTQDGSRNRDPRYESSGRGRAQMPPRSGSSYARQQYREPQQPPQQPPRHPLDRNVGSGGRAIYVSSGSQGGFDFASILDRGKLVLMGIAALVILVFIITTAYSCSPTTFHVNGQEVEAARSTTYRGLIDQGLLEAQKGDLVSVDDEVLEEGAGKDPTVFLDGQPVDLDARVSEEGNVTAEDGENEIEPYTATQDVTPFTTEYSQLTGGGDFNFYSAPLHVVTNPGQDGIVETRTGETTGRTAKVKVQDMEPRTFESLEGKLSANNKLIALTFDDGPNPNDGGTQDVLDVLAKYDVKATFFMLGTQAEEYPDMARKVAQAGHQIASHSYSHAAEDYLNATTEENAKYQVSHAREVLQQATGEDAHYIRPPGGNIDSKGLRATLEETDGYIGWITDTEDWTLPGSNVIAQRMISEAAPGTVILVHDGGGDRSQTVAALNEAIPKLQAEGYTFVTIDELVDAILKERNSKPVNGTSYGADASADDQANAANEAEQPNEGAQAEEGNGETDDADNADETDEESEE
ncbi:MAG: polysaccharide deacetylase family protein [Coriobacteriia bacterium]|nr:polysaccharide deacetylase family protein [Coriobacteriia bacterium]